MSEGSYMRIDEKTNPIDSLERALIFLREAEKDLMSMKWFVVAIHHAIYHFMLLALSNTDQSGIWKEPIIRRSDGLIDLMHPENRLISFMTALKFIQDSARMSGYVNSKPFQAKPYHAQSMKRLNDRLRNVFVHYKPLAWSIHDKYILDVINPGLEIIEFLVEKSGRCRLDQEEVDYIIGIINKIRKIIDKYYEKQTK